MLRSPADALSAVSDAIAIAEPLGLDPVLLPAYITLGNTHAELGHENEASAAHERAKSTYSRLYAKVMPAYRDAFRRRYRTEDTEG
jgi:hypothetical protein